MKTDTEILDWLIKQGPPGATEDIGLNESAWDAAYLEHPSPDKKCMRDALSKAMED